MKDIGIMKAQILIICELFLSDIKFYQVNEKEVFKLWVMMINFMNGSVSEVLNGALIVKKFDFIYLINRNQNFLHQTFHNTLIK